MFLKGKKTFKIIGLMSGTSHDGIDSALVEISEGKRQKSEGRGQGYEIQIRLISHLHSPYNMSLRDEISKAFSGDTARICKLNFELGEVFAKAALSLLNETGIEVSEIDAIASHGQTIYHIPPTGKHPGSTLQIGESSVIAERTGILTVSDFRTRDMAAKGQGAPLVPLADYLLFKESGKIRAVLNIGGIANVTIVRDKIEETIAFDIGPGNSLMDEVVKICTEGRMRFDRNGMLAKAGRHSEGLLRELLNHFYFRKKPPKSTGRETFGFDMAKSILKRYHKLPFQDIVSTLAHLTAITIYDAIKPFYPDEVIVTGGGIKNRFLMELLKTKFKGKGVMVRNIIDYGIPPEAKEALSFAILGYHTLKMMPGNIPSVTGATHRVILGKITLP